MNKLKIIRKELGISVYDLADKTHLSPSYISNLENGQKSNPSKNVMEIIAGALDKSVPEIFF